MPMSKNSEASKTVPFERLLDPKFLKPRMIYVSLFVTTYELLKSTVIDRIKDFFINGFDESGWRIDLRYKTTLNATGKKGVLGQSLFWLKEHGAIDDLDIESFQNVRDYRHKLVHELPDIISNFNAETESKLLAETIRLLRKIEVWWIQNVEIPTDPDHDGQEVLDEDIVPGTILFYQMLAEIALGEEEEAEKYLKEFLKHNSV